MKILFFLSLFLGASAMSFGQSKTIPCQLLCEHLLNPIGIDAVHPRLSWKMLKNAQGIRQISYTLTVSADSLSLVKNVKNGNKWEISKQPPEQLTTYQGRPLRPFTRYYWKVTLSDQNEKKVASGIATFETGIMNQANWKGDWITDVKDIDLGPAPCYRRQFTIGKTIRWARAYIAVAGLYEL